MGKPLLYVELTNLWKFQVFTHILDCLLTSCFVFSLTNYAEEKTVVRLIHTPSTVVSYDSGANSGVNTPLTVASYESDEEENEYTAPNMVKEFSLKCRVNNNYVSNAAELEHFSVGFLMACKDNNVSLVKILADTIGIDLIDTQDREGNTALIYACKMGNYDVAQVLLSYGANVHLKNGQNCDALMCACEKVNNDHIVELLLTNGACVNTTNSCELTPLCMACKVGAGKTVELLLKYGAIVDQPHGNGCSPLFLSCINGDIKIVTDLLSYGALVNRINVHGYSALLFACEHGHSHIVKLLIENGADLNVQNSYGMSGLILAIQHFFYSIVDQLLGSGCDVNIIDRSGKTALIYAVMSKNKSLISVLLDHQADMTHADVDGNTALHFACRTGSDQLVSLLLHANISVIEGINCYGNSSFMVACEFGCINVCKLLIYHNVDTTVQNFDGDTWSEVYGSGLDGRSCSLDCLNLTSHIRLLQECIRQQNNWIRRKNFVILLVRLGYIRSKREQIQLDLTTVLTKAVRGETSSLEKLLYNKTLVHLIISYI